MLPGANDIKGEPDIYADLAFLLVLATEPQETRDSLYTLGRRTGLPETRIKAKLSEFHAERFLTGSISFEGIPRYLQITPKGRVRLLEILETIRDVELDLATPPDAAASMDVQAARRLFISHSHTDEVIVSQLVRLVERAFLLPAEAIRCSSVSGYGFVGGADVDEHIRNDVDSSAVFVGILSEASMSSMYVLFELGARWGARKPLIPLLVRDFRLTDVRGPLAGIRCLRADDRADLLQLLDAIQRSLGRRLRAPALYDSELDALIALARDRR